MNTHPHDLEGQPSPPKARSRAISSDGRAETSGRERRERVGAFLRIPRDAPAQQRPGGRTGARADHRRCLPDGVGDPAAPPRHHARRTRAVLAGHGGHPRGLAARLDRARDARRRLPGRVPEPAHPDERSRGARAGAHRARRAHSGPADALAARARSALPARPGLQLPGDRPLISGRLRQRRGAGGLGRRRRVADGRRRPAFRRGDRTHLGCCSCLKGAATPSATVQRNVSKSSKSSTSGPGCCGVASRQIAEQVTAWRVVMPDDLGLQRSPAAYACGVSAALRTCRSVK